MSYQKVQNFKCRCPLVRLGIYGIHESHQVPNIPCDRSLNDVFLNQHLQWYHNFDSVSARKLVRAICSNMSPNEPLFSIHETVVKRNISVESYKCKCPLTHDGVFGLSDEHDLTNIPCGRAEKEVLCYQHLQYHHNLSSRAAKKIVLAILSFTPTITQLFHDDDLVTQSKCAVRKLKSKCPLLARHMYGLCDQHQVPNIPCDRADQHIFLFHHLTYFHKLNAKAATKLIRALLINKDPAEPLFHYNDTIVVSNQALAQHQQQNHHHHHQQQHHQQQQKQRKARRPRKLTNNLDDQTHLNALTYSHPFDPSSIDTFSPQFVGDVRTKYHTLLNAINTTALSASFGKLDHNNVAPLDCSRLKQQPCQTSYSSYSTSDMAHAHGLDLNSFMS